VYEDISRMYPSRIIPFVSIKIIDLQAGLHSLPGVRLVTWTILGVTPGCQIGYMDHTGCHSRVSDWLHGPYWLSLPGVRLVTWIIELPAVID
jgi:hypothetical protein